MLQLNAKKWDLCPVVDTSTHMPEKPAHPSKEQLKAFSLGKLTPVEADFVEVHINQCQPCSKIFVEMIPEDPFVRLLKETIQLPSSQTFNDGSFSGSLSSTQELPQSLANHLRYEIVGLIGKGGMGDVYKARHLMMDRTVALKIINGALVRKTEAVNRFHREVKAAAKLSHPNIVTAHDAEQAGGLHFMVMEYVDGVDLSEKTKELGVMPVEEACAAIQQVANGLQHAYELGMVHRDIKPQNLMVADDGTVKILDFGLASLAPATAAGFDATANSGALTVAGTIMGTPDFISPEQANDARQADIRSDIYSLGSTLYFLLTGKAPFADLGVKEKLESHARSNPKPLNLVNEEIPSALVSVVEKMMAKDANDRFQTPQEVANALDPFVVGIPNNHSAAGRLQNNAFSKAEAKPELAGINKTAWVIGSTALITIAGLVGFLVALSDDEEAKAYKALRVYLETGDDSKQPIDQVEALLKNERGRDYLKQLDDEFRTIAFFKGRTEHGKNPAIALVMQDTRFPNSQQLIIRTQGKNLHSNSKTNIPRDQASVDEIQISKGEFNHRMVKYRITISHNPEPDGISDTFKLIPGVTYEFDLKLSDLVDPENGGQTTWQNATFVKKGGDVVDPFLRIFNVDTLSATLGNDVRRTWKFSGHRIGKLTVRLIHITNSQSKVAHETVLDCNELAEPLQTGEIALRIEDFPNDKVSLTLLAFAANLSPEKREVRETPLLIKKNFGQSDMQFVRKWRGQRVKPNNTAIVHRFVLLPDEKKWQPILRSIESMEKASEKGHQFIVVTLDWELPKKAGIESIMTIQHGNSNAENEHRKKHAKAPGLKTVL